VHFYGYELAASLRRQKLPYLLCLSDFIAMQVDRRRQHRRMPQIPSSYRQFHAPRQHMLGAHMPRPMRTDMAELVRCGGMVGANDPSACVNNPLTTYHGRCW